MSATANAPVHASERLTLWYRQPAKEWIEALPVGNGRLGAMVFGKIDRERIQLNENTLWDGHPQDTNNPEALKHLPEVRRLLFAGKNQEATELADKYLMGHPKASSRTRRSPISGWRQGRTRRRPPTTAANSISIAASSA